MALTLEWMRSKSIWILLLFACVHVIIVVLQTHNPSHDNRNERTSSNDQQPANRLDNVQGNKTSTIEVEKMPHLKPAVRTPDIPFNTFESLSKIYPFRIKEKIVMQIPDKYESVRFLKNMPSYEEMRDTTPRSSEFGEPRGMGCDDSYCHLNGRYIKREIILENPKDMFTFLPPEEEFLKEFKNPCWKGQDISGRRTLFCLPYFFIIGFTKCGTTDLFAMLKSHYLIWSRATKETHFFDRTRRGRSPTMHRLPDAPPKSFMCFVNRGLYRDSLMRTFHQIEGTDVLFHGITMDATPSYVWDNEFWETFHPGYREPPVTNADTIAAINPKTKIIFSLRDPINRMRSAYQYFCSVRGPYPCDKPVTPEKYHNLVMEAVEKFNNCLMNNTVRGCTYSTETHQLATHLYASLYHVYISDFMTVFPRDQLYVLKMEEHIRDPLTSSNELCDFLDVPRFPEGFDLLQERDQVRNQIKDKYTLPYVLPETEEILEEFFRPYLRDLVHLLGDEKWYWNRSH